MSSVCYLFALRCTGQCIVQGAHTGVTKLGKATQVFCQLWSNLARPRQIQGLQKFINDDVMLCHPIDTLQRIHCMLYVIETKNAHRAI